ncbi:MAG: putative metalloprotease CJM1_0395 family protein [Pseudomonadota bacterium]|nr:putative metalloprotease CJM1_0395 family protein [Pseudomonadota bacterium]
MNVSASQSTAANYYSVAAITREGNADPRQSGISPENSTTNKETEETRTASKTVKENSNALKGPLDELSADEQRQVDQLKRRDAEVKAHERAHIAAGGPYVSGGASYEYERGPDNQNYAVGGEVSIDVSAENTPEATIRKMQIVKRAALAPRDPSGQDRSVAAQAVQTEARARIELQKERSAESDEKDEKISSQKDTANTSADNRLAQQATAAYRQTEFTTNPLTAAPNHPSFSALA